MIGAEARGKHLRQYCHIGFACQRSDTLFRKTEIGLLIRPSDGIL
jgi:hypothetical protein